MKYRIVIEKTERYEVFSSEPSETDALKNAGDRLKRGDIILDVPIGKAHIRIVRAHPSAGNL